MSEPQKAQPPHSPRDAARGPGEGTADAAHFLPVFLVLTLVLGGLWIWSFSLSSALQAPNVD